VPTLIVPNVLSVVVDVRPVTTAFEGAADSTLLPFLRSSVPPTGENVDALLVTLPTLMGAAEVEVVAAGAGELLFSGWVSLVVGTFLGASAVVDELLPLLSDRDGTGGKSESK